MSQNQEVSSNNWLQCGTKLSQDSFLLAVSRMRVEGPQIRKNEEEMFQQKKGKILSKAHHQIVVGGVVQTLAQKMILLPAI